MRPILRRHFCVLVLIVLATMQVVAAIPGVLVFDACVLLESDALYRYRFAERDWEGIGDGPTALDLPGFDDDDFLIIQKSSQGLTWDEELCYRYDRAGHGWVRVGDPLADVRLAITASNASTTLFRYQVGTSPQASWSDAIPVGTPVLLPWLDPVTFLYVQLSRDGRTWSDAFKYRYITEAEEWKPLGIASDHRLSVAPYAAMMRTASPIAHLYETSYGGGLEFMHSMPFNPRLLLVADISVSHAASNNVWMDEFLILGAGIGFGYRMGLTEKLDVVPSVTYGVLAHTGTADLEDSGSPGRLWYLDQQVRGALRLELKLSDRMGLMVKPEAAVFFEANNVGVLYGIGAGLQFGW